MIFKILLLAVAAASAVPLGIEQQWNQFKLTHNKVYDNQDEENYRFKVFSDYLQKMEEHNAKYEAGLVSWEMGVNRFSDMTTEEFEKFLQCSDMPTILKGTGETVNYSQAPAPSIDLRSYFNPIRDQGFFETCYAFATTSAVEAYRNGMGCPRQILSPQDIIDCTYNVTPYNNNGSYGGYTDTSLQYMADKGITLEKDYPYVGNTGRCKHDGLPIAVRISGYLDIENSASNLINALNLHGPLTITVNATEWRKFRGGILHPTHEFNSINHAVVLVGYGTSKDTNEDYWLVRNSWGSDYGENGYIRVARKVVGNIHFGIAGPGSYPAQIPFLLENFC